MLVAAILVVSSQVFAAPARETVKRLSQAEAIKAAKETPGFDEIMAMKDQPAKRNEVIKKIDSILKLKLENVVTLDITLQSNLSKIVKISPLEVLAEIIRQTSIISDQASTPREKEMAKLTIELIAKSSQLVSGVLAPGETAPTPAKVKEIMDLSNKIAAMEFGTTSKKFVEAYEKALRNGATTEQAVRIASKNKFTEKELRECQ